MGLLVYTCQSFSLESVLKVSCGDVILGHIPFFKFFYNTLNLVLLPIFVLLVMPPGFSVEHLVDSAVSPPAWYFLCPAKVLLPLFRLCILDGSQYFGSVNVTHSSDCFSTMDNKEN